MTAPITAAEERLDQAHSVYLAEVARLDEILRVTADAMQTPRARNLLRLAARALSEASEATVASAVTLASPAGGAESETALRVATRAMALCSRAFAAMGLAYPPSRLRTADARLMDIAWAIRHADHDADHGQAVAS
ncbi:hypothetical protein Ga0074812_14825 [Parafrankia irregularis]|uniref:Uncharacterized protein n=1 Tax=Parafrankia irregularis TaxID=795642 RepID=A0A0S4R041_9ACTN|nr:MULTISPECIES: hypothetical protein [Parafrankia]MBE3206751.1 hypothetical protein [Parafrankia sp. CH37]CUU60825.1 hypothetical protein Ga0074812_14825 [Parafrankia irregularis]